MDNKKPSRFKHNEKEDQIIAGAINSPEQIESDEITRLKKELEAQKKIVNEFSITYILNAPKREIDGIPNVPYNTKVHGDVIAFINEHTKGSQNIVMNFLMREGIKIIKERLRHTCIQINAKGIIQDND